MDVLLNSSSVHFAATVIHVFAGVFWLGWMVFMFLILRPSAKQIVPEDTARLQQEVQRRIRAAVFWMIPTLIITGLYNMNYRGLLDWETLAGTGYGHRMLAKLGAATLMFAIYYMAPFILRATGKDAPSDHDPADCHGHPDVIVQRVSVVLHVLAFASGVTAAYLGVTLGG
jgi:uncharacterized membrane protein